MNLLEFLDELKGRRDGATTRQANATSDQNAYENGRIRELDHSIAVVESMIQSNFVVVADVDTRPYDDETIKNALGG